MRPRIAYSLALLTGAFVFSLACSIVSGESTGLVLAPPLFAPFTILTIAALAFTANCLQTEFPNRVLNSAQQALGGALLASSGFLFTLATIR